MGDNRKYISPGVYLHFKGGLYSVIGTCRHSETKEWYVVYKSLDSDNDDMWIRPYDMFISEVDKEKYPDCSQKYRFERI